MVNLPAQTEFNSMSAGTLNVIMNSVPNAFNVLIFTWGFKVCDFFMLFQWQGYTDSFIFFCNCAEFNGA